MLISAAPRLVFGFAGAVIVSALLLAPYDFAAAAWVLLGAIQDGASSLALS
jgi:hypothetical protein